MTYHLIIDDIIGVWGYSKQWVARELAKYQGQHVDVKISSRGGDLDHGLDIRRQFIDHGDVTVHICGMTASAATVIATGAKKVVMSPGAFFLVHKCSNMIDLWGSYNADQMQAIIDDLTQNKKENDRIDAVLAQLYAKRCGKKVEEIAAVLKAGEWLSPQQALEWGFVDEISQEAADIKLDYRPEMRAKLNAVGLSIAGLPEVPQCVKPTADAGTGKKEHTQPKNISTMDDHKFNTVASLLGLDTLVADKDNYVSVTAEQMAVINDRLEALAREKEDAGKAKAKAEDELSSLKTSVDALSKRVDNLMKAPGAETNDIQVKDDCADKRVTSSQMYDQIKDLI